MKNIRPVRLLVVGLLVLPLLSIFPVDGQTRGTTPTFQDDPYLDDSPSRRRREPIRNLAFALLRDIRLPGPLPPGSPRLVGDRVEIDVAGGVAVTDWDGERSPTILGEASQSSAPVGPEPGWVESPDGQFRYRAEPSGRIVAQKRCRRCSKVWRKKWQLRVSGSTLAPPLATEQRLYFGALDNRVYALRRRNGHRLWAVDVEGRVSTPLVALSYETPVPPDTDESQAPPAPALELILVVPGDGSRLLALDAESGRKLASYTLTEAEGKLVGVPVVTSDGAILMARQKYAPEEASLMVFRLGAAAERAAGDDPTTPEGQKGPADGAEAAPVGRDGAK